MKKIILTALFSFAFFAVIPVFHQSYAANICWDGGGSTNNWSEDANWALDTEPGTGDVAVFDNGTCTGTPNKNATIDSASISVQGINIVSYTGTITQNDSTSFSLGSSGYIQASATSTYDGSAVITDGGILISSEGDFSLSAGVFSAPVVLFVDDDFTHSGGTFTHNDAIVVFNRNGTSSGATTITGSTTLAYVAFVDSNACSTETHEIASGTVITAEGSVLFAADDACGVNDSELQVNGPGEIYAEGDVEAQDLGVRYTSTLVTVTINGDGPQALVGEDDDNTMFPNIIIDKPSGTLTFGADTSTERIAVIGDWTYIQGTIDASTYDSEIIFSDNDTDGNTLDITGDMTFENLRFADYYACINDVTIAIATGTTITTNGTLTFESPNACGIDAAELIVNGPGEINAYGDVAVVGYGVRYTSTLVTANVNGTGSQALIGENDEDTGMPSLVIDKTSGTLTFGASTSTERIGAAGDWTYIQGTLDTTTYDSEVIFIEAVGCCPDEEKTITGDAVFNRLKFDDQEPCGTVTYTLSSGSDITVLSSLILDSVTNCNRPETTVNGPGTLTVQGNITTDGFGADGNVAITLTGSNKQFVNINSADDFPTGTFTINKSSESVVLLGNLVLNGTGQDLVVSSGTLDMGSFALTVDDEITVDGGLIQRTGNLTASNGNMTVGSTGHWTNNDTGDFVMDGSDTLTNNGYVRLDGAGSGCGGTDGIVLTRSGTGSVNLAGSGRWRVYDANFSNYAASPGITVYSSTNTTGNTGITFTTCPSEVTWNGSGGDSNYNTGANWTGGSAPSTTDLAVFDATSTKSATLNVDPDDNGFQLNNGFTLGVITQTNGVDITLDDQGWEQNDGTFTGGDATSDMTINNGGDFTLNGGTFTAPEGVITAKDNWTIAGGTFDANSGTVTLSASSDDAATITGSSTFSNLYFDGPTGCASARTFTIASGTLTVDGTSTFEADGVCGRSSIDGPGTITANGDVTISVYGYTGDTTITVGGSADQTFTGAGYYAILPEIVILKTGGTLDFTGEIGIREGWTVSPSNAGTLDFGTSELFFYNHTNGTEMLITPGDAAYNDVTFYADDGCSNVGWIDIASGSTMNVGGDLTFDGQADCQFLEVNGPGGLIVQGDVTVSGGTVDGDLAVTLGGTNSQTLTDNIGDFPTGIITVNKPSGVASLGSNFNVSESGQDMQILNGTFSNAGFDLTVNDTLTITSLGRLSHGTGDVEAGTFVLGPGGIWENLSTGDAVIGSGGVINNGLISFGDLHTCGENDDVTITSSSGGNQRAWSGNGGFEMYDVSVTDQGGSAGITVFSGTSVSNNDTNWTFNGTCPTAPPGTRIRGGGANLRGGTRIP